jgi:hypothetical protein
MGQKSGNDVQPPVHGKGDVPESRAMKKDLVDNHHGENTKSPQDERNIGQHNGAGRPPLMKK